MLMCVESGFVEQCADGSLGVDGRHSLMY